MQDTAYMRLTKLLELVKEDAACAACAEDVTNAEALLEDFLRGRPKEESMVCNALPVTLRVYYGRVLELVSREMRFADE